MSSFFLYNAPNDYRNYLIHSYEIHQDKLYHYGIKGMKWGVRKDPVDKFKVKLDSAVQKAKNKSETKKKIKQRRKRQKYMNIVKPFAELDDNDLRYLDGKIDFKTYTNIQRKNNKQVKKQLEKEFREIKRR